MVRKEFINQYNIEFQEVPANNDLMFSVKAGHYVPLPSAGCYMHLNIMSTYLEECYHG